MKKSLDYFWHYALESHRETDRATYGWAFLFYIVPMLILVGRIETSVQVTDTGFQESMRFTLDHPYVLLAYGLWIIPVASLTISRLKTLGRRVAWALLLFIPVLGPILTLWPCLREKGRSTMQPLIAPGKDEPGPTVAEVPDPEREQLLEKALRGVTKTALTEVAPTSESET